MQIGHISPQSHIYGPSIRFVIWTQGCSIQCPGCWNENFWKFGAGKEYSISELMQLILAHSPIIEGVTLLGGEPFDQGKELLELAEAIHKNDLTLMIYSGYTLNEIKQKGYASVLSNCDILIAGRYNHKLRDTSLRWRGSSNQNVLFLSPRYSNFRLQEAQEIEIIFDEDGGLNMYGYPESWITETSNNSPL